MNIEGLFVQPQVVGTHLRSAFGRYLLSHALQLPRTEGDLFDGATAIKMGKKHSPLWVGRRERERGDGGVCGQEVLRAVCLGAAIIPLLRQLSR
jgi:hypothetical protein